MGFGVQSFNLVPSGSVGVQVGVTKTTAISISGAGINNTVTLGTVTALKTWRIIGIQLCCNAGADNQTATIQLNGVTIAYLFVRPGAGGAPAVATTSQKFDYANCPVGTAGQTVTLVSAVSANTSAVVQYIEE